MLERMMSNPLLTEETLMALAVTAVEAATGRVPPTDVELAAGLRAMPGVVRLLHALAERAGVRLPRGIQMAHDPDGVPAAAPA